MKKPVIVIKVTAKQFKALAALIQYVLLNMLGNLEFITPSPALIAVQAALTDLQAAIAAWGVKGNRGSHATYVSLKVKSTFALALLTQLGEYCMTVVDPNSSFDVQTTLLLSSGFPIKNASIPVGMLGMVENFRRVFSATVSLNNVKLRWRKPLNTSRGNVKSYLIYRNTTNNFASATFLTSVQPSTYIDSPGTGIWYYWVAATNNSGNGITSNVVVVNINTP